MIKRELKRVKNNVEKFMDPVAIVIMMLILLLPTLAVVNLSPLSKADTRTNRNVLGESDGESMGFVMVGGIHDYVKEELLDFPSQDNFRYQATLIKHNKGRYSKPIVQIVNNNSEEKEVLVSALLSKASKTTISFIINDKEYILVSSQGEPFTTTIKIPSKSENIGYLKFVSDSDTMFNNSVELTFTSK